MGYSGKSLEPIWIWYCNSLSFHILHIVKTAVGKREVLWNGIGSSQPPSKLKINEQEVEILDPHASTMYLGKSLSLTEVHDTELQHRIARAWTKFAVYKDELCNKKYELMRSKDSGLTLEFRFLVSIGRSGVMIGRICLNMVY